MWQAKFSNGDILKEFNEKGQEVLFRTVLEKLDDLESLSIILGEKMFTVRMTDGRFTFNTNGEENHFFISDQNITALSNIRPIYFVREQVNLTVASNTIISETSPTVNFTALGFQANVKNSNIKRYLKIFPNGAFIVKVE